MSDGDSWAMRNELLPQVTVRAFQCRCSSDGSTRLGFDGPMRPRIGMSRQGLSVPARAVLQGFTKPGRERRVRVRGFYNPAVPLPCDKRANRLAHALGLSSATQVCNPLDEICTRSHRSRAAL